MVQHNMVYLKIIPLPKQFTHVSKLNFLIVIKPVSAPKCLVPLALCKHFKSKCLDVLSLWQRTIEISLMSTFQSIDNGY